MRRTVHRFSGGRRLSFGACLTDWSVCGGGLCGAVPLGLDRRVAGGSIVVGVVARPSSI